jgi:predicted TIM-barrel fold metal-dependent hydrolase
MRRIDSHIHYAGDHPDDLALLEHLGLKLLNVCVAHDATGWLESADIFGALSRDHPEAYAWVTSFDPAGFEEPDYADRVVEGLKKDLADGAVACKAWKNIGMEIRKSSGEFIMIDDPVYQPVFEFLEREGVTLLGHLAEPLQCWKPLDESDPHYGYYKNNPKWHLHGKPGYPSHQDIIDARDRVVERHPGLRFVGAHIGSLEHDVAEVARRFDRYPNFAVDTSARTRDLAVQDPAVVRQFFADYPDRILFGTDVVSRRPVSSELSPEDRNARLDSLEIRYRQEFAFFESTGTTELRGREVEALGFPEDILEKFYCTNARAWYPGI